MNLWEYFLCAKKKKRFYSTISYLPSLPHTCGSLVNARRLTRMRRNCWIKMYFAHKKYSHTFIKLRLNYWCYMDYFINVFITFLGLEHVSSVAVCRVRKLWFHQKYLNLCSEDEQRSYGFGTTWGSVINDIISVFGWTILLNWIQIMTDTKQIPMNQWVSKLEWIHQPRLIGNTCLYIHFCKTEKTYLYVRFTAVSSWNEH